MFCVNCGKELTEGQFFCPNCGQKSLSNAMTDNNSVKEIAVQDAFSYQQIFDFLKHVKTLETEKFTLQQIVAKIWQNIHNLNFKTPVKDTEKYSEMGIKTLGFVGFALIAGIVIWFLKSCGSILSSDGANADFSGFFLIVGVCVGIVVLLSIFLGIIDILINRGKKKRYRQRCENEDRLYAKRLEKIEILEGEIDKYNDQIKQVDELLEKLYALNVMPQKYCSLVPVVTIYEYFEVGKCNSLRGRDGAYVLYDDEARHNVIIAQLDLVIEQLASIAQTQRMLYDAIQDANQISQEIASQNIRLLTNQKSIDANTAAIAYNTKRIEECSRVSAYVDAFLS